MNPVVLQNVHYTWKRDGTPIFEGLSLELPSGVVSLMGQNGTGKSTFLLLAGGVLLPQQGRVMINGVDSAALRDEEIRHREVSFIYQNLEFETEEPIGELLEFVYDNGFHAVRDQALLPELVEVFELEKCLSRRTQEISKGELQRTILAFSLLYGSRIVMMDEPVFALEEYQKRRTFDYLVDYARRRSVSIYYSVHELELSQEYSEYVLLFGKEGPPELGPTAEMTERERVEEAYQVPYSMLKHRERVYRKILIQRAKEGLG